MPKTRLVILGLALAPLMLCACEGTGGGAPASQFDARAMNACEKCEASLSADSEAYACSSGCTFCPDCTRGMAHVCPNCGGYLEPRKRA